MASSLKKISTFVREADKYKALNSEEKFIADAYASTNMMNFNDFDARCQQSHFNSFKNSVDEMIASQEQQDYDDEHQAVQDRKNALLDHMKDIQTIRIDKDKKMLKSWKQTQRVKNDRQIRDLQYEMCRETVAELKVAKSNSIHRKKQQEGIDQFETILKRNGIGGDDDGQALTTTYEEGEAFIKRLEETAMKKWPSNENVDEFLLHLKKRTSGNRIARYEKACRKRRMLVEQMAASAELAIDDGLVEVTSPSPPLTARRLTQIASPRAMSPRPVDKAVEKAEKLLKTQQFCQESVSKQEEDAELYLQIFSEQTRMMADDDGGRDQELQSVRALRDAKNLEKRIANEYICKSVLEDWLNSHPVFGISAAMPKKDDRGQRLSESLSSCNDTSVYTALITVFEEYIEQYEKVEFDRLNGHIAPIVSRAHSTGSASNRGSPTMSTAPSRKHSMSPPPMRGGSVCASPGAGGRPIPGVDVRKPPTAATLEDCNMISTNPHTWSLSVAMSNNIGRWTYAPPSSTAEQSVAAASEGPVENPLEELIIETGDHVAGQGDVEIDMLTGEPIALSTMQSYTAESSSITSSTPVVPLLSRSSSYSEEWEKVLTTLSEYFIDDAAQITNGTYTGMAPSQEDLCRRLMVTSDEVATLTAMSRSTILVMGRKNNDVISSSPFASIDKGTWNQLVTCFKPLASKDEPVESLLCVWDITTAIEVGKKLQADSKNPVTFASLVDIVSMGTEKCPADLTSTKFSSQASRILGECSDLAAKILACEKVVFPLPNASPVQVSTSSFPFTDTSICILLGHSLWLRAYVVEKITASGSCGMAPIVLAGRLYSPASCNQSIHVKVVSHFMAGGTKDSVDNDPELEALLAAEMGSGKPPKPAADDIVLSNKVDAVVWIRNGTVTDSPNEEEPEQEEVEPEVVAPKGKKGKAEDETPGIIRPSYEVASKVLQKFAKVSHESINHSKDNFPVVFAEETTACPPVYCLSCEEEKPVESTEVEVADSLSGAKTPASSVVKSYSKQMDNICEELPFLGSDENDNELLVETTLQPEEIINPVSWVTIHCPVEVITVSEDETIANMSAIHTVTAVVIHHANRCVKLAKEAADRLAERERELEEEGESRPSSPLEEDEEDKPPSSIAFRLTDWQEVMFEGLNAVSANRLDAPALVDKLWLFHKTCHHKMSYALLQKALSALQLSKAIDMEMNSLMYQIIGCQFSLFQSKIRESQAQMTGTIKSSDDRWKNLCGNFLKQVVVASQQQESLASSTNGPPSLLLTKQMSVSRSANFQKSKKSQKPSVVVSHAKAAKFDFVTTTDELICSIGNTIDERHMKAIELAHQLTAAVCDSFKSISNNLINLLALINRAQNLSRQFRTDFGKKLSELLSSLGCAGDYQSTSSVPLVSLGLFTSSGDASVSDALTNVVSKYNAALESLTSLCSHNLRNGHGDGSRQSTPSLEELEWQINAFKEDKTGNVNYCCEELCAEGLVSLTALIRSCECEYKSIADHLNDLQPLLQADILRRTKYEHGILTKWAGELKLSFGMTFDSMSPTIGVNRSFSLSSADSASSNINFPSAIAFLTKYYFGVSDDAHQDSVAWISNVGMIDVADFALTGKEIKVLATELSYVLVKVMKGSQNRSSNYYVPIPGEFLIMCIRNLVDKRVTLPPPWRDSSRLHALANVLCGPVDSKLHGTGKEATVRLAALRNLSQKLVIVLILGIIRYSASVEYVQHLYDVLSKPDTGASALLAKQEDEGNGLPMSKYMARVCTDDILAPGWWTETERAEGKRVRGSGPSKDQLQHTKDLNKQKLALFMEAIALVCCDDQQRVVISDVMVLMCMLPSLNDHQVSLQKTLQMYPQEQAAIKDGASATVLHPSVFKLAHVVQNCIRKPETVFDGSLEAEDEPESVGVWSQTSETQRYRRDLGIQLTEYQMNWLCECLLPSHTVPPTEYDAVAEPNPAVELPPPPYSLMDGIKMQKNAFRRWIAERMDVPLPHSPQLETEELLPFTHLLSMNGSAEFLRHITLLLQADKLALPRKL